MAVTRWCHIPDVEIVAVCDASKQVTEEVAQHVEQLGKPRPAVFWGEKRLYRLMPKAGNRSCLYMHRLAFACANSGLCHGTW